MFVYQSFKIFFKIIPIPCWKNKRHLNYLLDVIPSAKDSFAVGITHKDGERAVLDVCRAWRPPFNPSGVIAEASDLLARYRISDVEGDRA